MRAVSRDPQALDLKETFRIGVETTNLPWYLCHFTWSGNAIPKSISGEAKALTCGVPGTDMGVLGIEALTCGVLGAEVLTRGVLGTEVLTCGVLGADIGVLGTEATPT